MCHVYFNQTGLWLLSPNIWFFNKFVFQLRVHWHFLRSSSTLNQTLFCSNDLYDIDYMTSKVNIWVLLSRMYFHVPHVSANGIILLELHSVSMLTNRNSNFWVNYNSHTLAQSAMLCMLSRGKLFLCFSSGRLYNFFIMCFVCHSVNLWCPVGFSAVPHKLFFAKFQTWPKSGDIFLHEELLWQKHPVFLVLEVNTRR